MLIACTTASFPQESLESALRRIAWAGFEAVEIDLRHSDAPEAAELAPRLRNEGLETAAIHAGAAPAGVGEEAFAEWSRIGRAAALAGELDCPRVAIHAPACGELAAFRDGLKLLNKALGDLSVEICLANRFGTVLATPDDFGALWGTELPVRVRLALDPAQAELAGWDPSDLDRLPSPPDHVYWNDVREGRVLPPGEGELPLFALAERLMRVTPPPRSLTVSLENADPWQVEPLAREAYRQTVVQFEPTELPDATL